MALTLSEQVAIKTPEFKELVLHAVLDAASAIFYEGSDVTNYEERRNLVKIVIVSPETVMDTFVNFVATRLPKVGYSEQDIKNTVSALWSMIALARF